MSIIESMTTQRKPFIKLNSKHTSFLWWRLWWGLAESAFGESLQSGGRFGVAVVGNKSGFSHSEGVSMFNLVYKDLHKFCTSQCYLQRYSTVNCITVQHTKKGQPVNPDGSYYASFYTICLLPNENTLQEEKGDWKTQARSRAVDLLSITPYRITKRYLKWTEPISSDTIYCWC
jgi:hypothetical protein